ncbi:hypothetical protein SAMN05421837_102599 [Amycolatopsis pretoriensis]|uniref:Uncharacterized protein n=1 Tax=Amycolatopsis pretoriensis TaxID=218821 RepID=A0A1H5QG26_9PSEU|nr:hypothetical protein SAMN05421837_102599 [Amycolatopsis pretoriensis]
MTIVIEYPPGGDVIHYQDGNNRAKGWSRR